MRSPCRRICDASVTYLSNWCDELGEMIQYLTLMYKRGGKMPIYWTPEYLESWWETFPPDADSDEAQS